jgi:phospholipase/carboxylesterase
MSPAELYHTCLTVPGADPDAAPMILLHGSGGSECDLIPLAAELAPEAPALAVRGTVPFEDGHAFFHRRADRSIDEADLRARLPALATLVTTQCRAQGFARAPIIVGFSNGAIMAAALLWEHPALVAGAILLRPLSPFIEHPPGQLNGKPVLIIDGEKDSRRATGDGARLAERMRQAGARVTHHVLPVGHAITDLDKQLARTWLTDLP